MMIVALFLGFILGVEQVHLPFSYLSSDWLVHTKRFGQVGGTKVLIFRAACMR